MTADGEMPGKLGPYRVLDRIGEGGMGVVYLARDRDHRAVAIKVLRPGVAEDPNSRRRLGREVETMRLVRSPHVAEVIDADLDGKVPYIVTRYVPGRTLDEVVAEGGALRGAELALLAQGLAGALTAVHAAGVVHRDLKPGNVMFLNGSPVVIDFGIAQVPGTSKLTLTGTFMGTPGYLSPEVIEGRPSSEASDVHAWGATVAFAATGRPPFGTGNYESIFYRITSGQADLAGVPPALLPLLAAALARDPAHRPSAIQLSAQAAVLEPAGLVAPPAAPAAPAGAVQPAGATRADARRGQPPGGPPGIIPAAGAAAAAAAGIAAGANAAVGDAAALAAPGELAAGGTAATGAAAAGPAGNGAAGGAPGTGIATSPGTRPLTGRQPGQQQRAKLRPGDYADVLPPVAWGGGPAADGRPTAAEVPAAAAGSPGGYALLALATMVTVVAVSVILPVAGSLVALALIVLLRAGESATRGRILRRSARGQRASDPLVSVVSYPWFLVRSALACAVVAPIALVVGALVAGITFVLVRVDTLPRAIAYAIGTVVAFYALGPGSRGARRQLTRIYAAAARGRALQAALLIVVGALAIATVAAALTSPSLYWPLSPPRNLLHLALSHVAATHPTLPHAPPPDKLLRDAVRLVFSHLPFW